MYKWRPIYTVVLLMAATGCSTPPQFMGITINAAPGNFSYVLADVKIPPGGADTTNIAMHFVRLQPTDRWASTFTTCIQGDDQVRDSVCLQLAVRRDGKVVPSRVVSSGAKGEIPNRQTLPSVYGSQDPFLLKIETDQQNVRFSVNGTQLFESETVKHPKRISFTCSSAVCAIDVRP